MRTTLNIADDVLYAVKERARREKRSAGEVLSDLARSALTTRSDTSVISEETSLYGFDAFPRRGSAVSNALIEELLEDEPE